jgi:uncharacterized membrane protein YeaQ/YmgE (transglycosylase-associated protein family)
VGFDWLDPALVLAALAGAVAVAVYGLAFVPPAGDLLFLLPSGLIGSIGGQLAAARVSPLGPTIGGLHLPEALVGAWLLVIAVRRVRV